VIAGHQAATQELWSKLSSIPEIYVSALVAQEAGRGNSNQTQIRLAAIAKFPMLDINDEARFLAEKIIAKKGIPVEYPEDALHIAVAAVNGIEVIITWNFAHLNNPFTRKKVRRIVEAEGYICPEICSPEELLEVE
jgi:predicted nucleic acid-binding protein